MPNEERHRFAYVDAHLDGSQVVGQYGDGDRLWPGIDLFIYRSDESLVEVFDGTQLEVEVAVVTSFVAGFDMYEDEILMTEGFDGSLRLTFIVGVGQSCGSFNLNNVEASIMADATDEVDG